MTLWVLKHVGLLRKVITLVMVAIGWLCAKYSIMYYNSKQINVKIKHILLILVQLLYIFTESSIYDQS
jgi:hypothetical protein